MRNTKKNITNKVRLSLFVLLFLFSALLIVADKGVAAENVNGRKPLWNEINISRIRDIPVDGNIEFFFCADLHIPFDDRGIVKKIVRQANSRKPDFVLLGGDLVQMGLPNYYTTLKKVLRKFRVPVISAIGNHDTSFSDYSDQRQWKKFFGNTFFYFDAGPARFIFLNNANFDLKDAQLGFLENALKTDLQKFIIMHRPVGYVNKLYITPLKGGSERFRELIEKAGVTAVMTGHEHHYGSYEVDGIKYIVSGGAGGRLNTNTKNNYHHYIIGNVGKDTFSFQVITL